MSNSTTLNFGKQLSLKEAAELIGTVTDNRFMIRGKPGIGKSSIMAMLREMYPTYHLAYLDVPQMDLGDVCMPVIDHENQVTKYYPNERFGLHLGKPVIIMLDEYTKGAEPVKLMLHPLLEAHNPRLGNVPLPKGSIVFMTGNLATDGVNDNIKGHSLGRITEVDIRSPEFEEWAEWAVNNDIDGTIIACCKQYQEFFACYTDASQKENPYIYNPKKQQQQYVSPRSLERASNILKQRHRFSQNQVIAALAGTVGEPAARMIESYIAFADQLPSWESIIANPLTAKIPDGAGASNIIVFGAIQKVDAKTIEPFMDYMGRFSSEWQSAFAINIAKSKTKQGVAFGCKRFSDWVSANEDLL
jgi:hypothetical protein